LVVFCILDFMMLWAYHRVRLRLSHGLVVLLTHAPRYASSRPAWPPTYVHLCPPSAPLRAEPFHALQHVQATEPPEVTTAGVPYEDTAPAPGGGAAAAPGPAPHSDETLHPSPAAPARAGEKPAALVDAAVDDRNAGVTHALAPAGDLPPPVQQQQQQPASARARMRDLPPYERRPEGRPVLLPENRYCGRDHLIKPLRTHHCRVCGTVSALHAIVLKRSSCFA
jgi:hypothetical protein